ncbi:mitochondrial large subunit ribosomal protein-domain-containing protein [Rhodocollybia butyracea]|uniref:Large ribosomal subunit protein mL49 n=1 Tax=Rhodocollybia butyracea TaxID=206335 RepID=A0A9P5Q197_9AGAR|nr:mitochondrial large subunit ribosomal protein-domain-containing protein [Rhodocollybia butyracea]
MLRSFCLPRRLPAATRFLSSLQRTSVHYPYFVPRNSNGSLPVYTDIRNGGTRFLLSIRNIDGDASALANSLSTELFAPGSPEAMKLQISVVRSKHLIIQGGKWKHNVVEWLVKKGF